MGWLNNHQLSPDKLAERIEDREIIDQWYEKQKRRYKTIRLKTWVENGEIKRKAYIK